MAKADFTVRAFNPRRPRPVFFPNLEKGLVGVAQPPKDRGGSITVQMQPGATIIGRLVDAAGKPQAGVALNLWFDMKKGSDWGFYPPERIETDQQGKFRLTALLLGHEFRLSAGRARGAAMLPLGRAPNAGLTKDLGDVQLGRAKE